MLMPYNYKNEDNYWYKYQKRYSKGEYRAKIFFDMVLEDIDRKKLNNSIVLLDIGCGKGFDNNMELQISLSRSVSSYIGIEPDVEIPLSSVFKIVHRCKFEDAPITEESVDIAFAVMVLEHIHCPKEFFNKIYEILKPGGVFFGFTVDSRHWFVGASKIIKYIGLKNYYLNILHGKTSEEHYENYPVFYNINTPKDIEGLTKVFSQTTVLNFRRIGAMDYYFPASLRWIGRLIDRLDIFLNRPGSVLAVRVVK